MPRLHVLDDLALAPSCPARWEEMRGDDRRRFCAQCSRHVYDLSNMASDEARLFLEEEGSSCVTFLRRSDGLVVTSDCDFGPPVQKRHLSGARSLLELMGALIILALTIRGAIETFGEHYPSAETQPLPSMQRWTGQLVWAGPKSSSRHHRSPLAGEQRRALRVPKPH